MSLEARLLGAAGRLAARGLDGFGGPRLSILILHRVLPASDPLFPAEVDVARFDRLMRIVAGAFEVLPLAVAARRLAAGSLPPRALSISFDDGYADNHDLALPVLRRHGLTACFFVATGFLDGGRMFNDTVIEAVRNSPLEQADLGEFGLARCGLATPLQRAALIGRLLPSFKYSTPDAREAALARLVRILRPPSLPDDLMMTSAQLQGLRRAGMEVGAHTVRHPILAVLDDADAEREMADSRSRLETLVDAPVTLFAYPNGRPDRDYDLRHVEIARRLGFEAAVSTAPGVARRGADLHQLPRYTPWNPAPWSWAARLVGARAGRSFATATTTTTSNGDAASGAESLRTTLA